MSIYTVSIIIVLLIMAISLCVVEIQTQNAIKNKQNFVISVHENKRFIESHEANITDLQALSFTLKIFKRFPYPKYTVVCGNLDSRKILLSNTGIK